MVRALSWRLSLENRRKTDEKRGGSSGMSGKKREVTRRKERAKIIFRPCNVVPLWRRT